MKALIKILGVLMATALLVDLAGCGGSGSSESSVNTNTSTTNTAAPSAPASWIDAFDQKMQAEMQSRSIPGMSVGVVEGNTPLLLKGYGLRDVENNLPVDSDTLFNIASTHKSITAALTAKLVDDSALGWNTPVINYYPAFKLSDAAATNSVTLTHLLSMGSGIPDNAENDLPQNATPLQVFSTVAVADLIGTPGAQFSYSNISTSLAGYIGVIASIGNDQALYDSYATLLKAHILDPIGMTRSTIYASKAQQDANLAKTYNLSLLGNPVYTPSIDTDVDALAPSGSLKSSAREMALYLSMHLNNGIAPNQSRVVSATNLLKTREPVFNDYGLGWEIGSYNNVPFNKHTGSYDNYVSVIVLIPSQNIGLVLLANSEQAAADLTEMAHQILIEALIADQ